MRPRWPWSALCSRSRSSLQTETDQTSEGSTAQVASAGPGVRRPEPGRTEPLARRDPKRWATARDSPWPIRPIRCPGRASSSAWIKRSRGFATRPISASGRSNNRRRSKSPAQPGSRTRTVHGRPTGPRRCNRPCRGWSPIGSPVGSWEAVDAAIGSWRESAATSRPVAPFRHRGTSGHTKSLIH